MPLLWLFASASKLLIILHSLIVTLLHYLIVRCYFRLKLPLGSPPVCVFAQFAPLAHLERSHALISTRTLGPIATTRRLVIALLWIEGARVRHVGLGRADVHGAELSLRAGHLFELLTIAFDID